MKKRIQISLLVFFVLAGIRLLVIYHERHAPSPAPKAAPANSNLSSDDYVVPTQIHAYDLKSAKEAVDGKEVWVKTGYQLYYYPYAGGRVDFSRAVGLLPPLDKVQITNLIQARAPNAKGEEVAPGVRIHEEQVMAAFHLLGDAKTYAVPVGGNLGGDYTFYLNEEFYFDDPHQLYSHWPAETWQAIEQHQAKPGMNELQVSFALGVGIPQGSGDYGNRTLQYDNNAHPVRVTFSRNRATDIQNTSGA